MDRTATLGARLLRAGVQDRERAEAAARAWPAIDPVVDALHSAADPDLAVLGASEALGDHLVRHPGHWAALVDPEPAPDPRGDLLRAVGADPTAAEPVAHATADALRVEYRRLLDRKSVV